MVLHKSTMIRVQESTNNSSFFYELEQYIAYIWSFGNVFFAINPSSSNIQTASPNYTKQPPNTRTKKKNNNAKYKKAP